MIVCTSCPYHLGGRGRRSKFWISMVYTVSSRPVKVKLLAEHLGVLASILSSTKPCLRFVSFPCLLWAGDRKQNCLLKAPSMCY